MDDIFVSGFVDEILDFMDYYEEQGNDRRSVSYALHFFDNYCYNKYREERTFTRDDANNFYKTKPKNLKDNTFYSITGTLNRFTSYLVALGYDIGVIQRIGKYKDFQFIPHIYSKDEKKRYCAAADSYTNVHRPLLNQMLPVMIRTLQCCGLRAGELVNIRQSDVHLESETPYILIRNSKNGLKRYCPLSPSLSELYEIFYTIHIKNVVDSEGFIFVDSSGNQITHSMLYEIHKELLYLANIRYDGHGRGPRIHDWRHTFCIESFQQLINSGHDSRNALMLVSAAMGHQHYTATERYLRLTQTMFPDISEALDKIYKNIG